MFLFITLYFYNCVSRWCVLCHFISSSMQTKITLDSLASKKFPMSQASCKYLCWQILTIRKKTNIIQFSKNLARSPYNDMWTVCSCWITPAVWCSEPVIRFNGCSILYSCHLTSPDWRSSTSVAPCSVGQDKLSVAVTFPKHVSMQNTNL